MTAFYSNIMRFFNRIIIIIEYHIFQRFSGYYLKYVK